LILALTTLFGLPAHPLLVHGAVALVPLAVAACVATGWRASWRKATALPVGLLVLAAAVFAFLAKQSGEPLQGLVRRAASDAGTRAAFGEHPEQGDRAMLFAILFGIVALGFLAMDRVGERLGLPPWAHRAAYGFVLFCGAIAVLTMAVAGHSGAVLVWRDVGSFAAGK